MTHHRRPLLPHARWRTHRALCGHLDTPVSHLMAVTTPPSVLLHAHPRTHSHTHTLKHVSLRLFHPFSQRKVLRLLSCCCVLPTVLLLYVFPLEPITAESGAAAPTFSCGFYHFWGKSRVDYVKYALCTSVNKLDDTRANNNMWLETFFDLFLVQLNKSQFISFCHLCLQ